MILNNFKTILGAKRLTISKVSKDTKISRPTLTSIYYNDNQSISMNILNTLCMYLNCSTSEFFSYIPFDITFTINPNESITTDSDFFYNEGDKEFISHLSVIGQIDIEKGTKTTIPFKGDFYNRGGYDINLMITLSTNKESYDSIAPYIFLEHIENEIINELDNLYNEISNDIDTFSKSFEISSVDIGFQE
ncbi:helix-turn-helix transcriptional regulator [Veillonella sp. 3913]|uniref:helix-turn-helix domain-containing protein n=1 Tax=Veillonella sp. 3913 TaxID=2490952 RepID=UPI000F8E0798|nr:helix-turn-helix transcriptional regulator [Veillonella sp. 3913]